MKPLHTNIIVGALVVIAIGLAAAYALFRPSAPAPEPFAGETYANEQYGFSFMYPADMEVRVREENVRQTTYLGQDADFFASLRDTVRDAKPTNIAYLYAVPGLTPERFKEALTASGPGIAVTSTEEVKTNGLILTKVVSTTEIGDDKIHYLFDRNGTMIVVSVFIGETEPFAPILQTFRVGQ